MYLCIYVSVYLFVYVSVYLSAIYLSIYLVSILSINLSFYLSIYHLSIIYLSSIYQLLLFYLSAYLFFSLFKNCHIFFVSFGYQTLFGFTQVPFCVVVSPSGIVMAAGEPKTLDLSALLSAAVEEMVENTNANVLQTLAPSITASGFVLDEDF